MPGDLPPWHAVYQQVRRVRLAPAHSVSVTGSLANAFRRIVSSWRRRRAETEK